MDSAFQAHGVFFLFAGFSFAATFFVYFYMAETKGLSDREKKTLYIPGQKFGRKLNESGEKQEGKCLPIELQDINDT